MKQIAYVFVGLLAGFMLAGALLLVTRLPEGKPIALEPPPTKAPIEVQVTGAVLRPGVYAFAEGSRVQDAITAAGGFLAEADSSAINLAAKLDDSQQLNIPYQAGAQPGSSPSAPFLVVPTSTAGPVGNLININTASKDELESLPGIGSTLAQRIVDYRTQHGPFQNIEDIMNVSGIGINTFDNIKNLITV